jgi:mannose-6-phosphate isomerase-like protein (cupin superfamily)
MCRLEPGGSVDNCVLAHERGIYVCKGELALNRAGEAFKLSADDYVLIPPGTPHALRNTGSEPVRWFEIQSPQPKPPGGWRDTFFVDGGEWPAQVHDPDWATVKLAGRFKAEKPMAPAAKGVAGLSVFRFMHREFGAHQFFMMRGELAVGGERSRHDHTVEEFYLALSGESYMDIEDRRFHLRPGDVVWTGVGASHAFQQTGPEPFRWLETQAPQFPAQGGTRNYEDWDRYGSAR